jgi:hypothetical protein
MTTSPAGGPSSDEPSTGGPPAADRPRDSRATTWMVISGVLALIAVGLGIWALTTKSDLDDANATIDEQEQQLASAEQTAQGEEARLRAFGERERAAFRRVRRRFIREEAEARNLKATISKEAAALEQARNEAGAAESQDQKDQAALKQARQEARLSTACVKGAVNALDRFFNASSARAGANGAVRELESIQDQCNQASQ